MQGAELVAVRIPQIGEIENAEGTLTLSWRILDRAPAGGDPRIMKRLDHLSRPGGKAYGAPVCVTGWLAVDRLADSQGASRRSPPVATPTVGDPGFYPERPERGVVETAGGLNIVGAQGDVGEHPILRSDLGQPYCRFRAL